MGGGAADRRTAKTNLFCLPRHIESYAGDVFGRLARDGHLPGRDGEGFLTGLAELWGGVNALHPFREGSGRATRAFLHQLARDAGHPVSWAGLDPAANIAASVAAHRGDPGPMRRLLDGLVAPPARPPAQPGHPSAGAADHRPRRGLHAAR